MIEPVWGGTSTQKHVRNPTPLVRKEPMEITLQMGGVGFDPELIIYYYLD